MTRRRAAGGKPRLVLSATICAAVMTGAVGAVALTGSRAAPASPARVRLSTATIERTNLATSVLTGGTLGYASSQPLINELAGTYTRLRAAGTTIMAGQVLYRVDNQPIYAMRGRTPAWRALAPGVSGPDVGELQANLIALGYASGLLTAPSRVYDLPTEDAVQRWQIATDAPVTGVVGFGQVIFVPGPLRVGGLNVAPGQAAAPGQQPYQVTTTKRVVAVPVNPTLPTVSVGERVSIVLPSQARTSGRVTAVGFPPPAAGTAGSHGSGAASSELTVTPEHPRATGTGTGVPVEVSLTVQSVRHVLAVPVSALLALSGGGYGLELLAPSGRHRLVGVTAGIFAGGFVQVSGAGVVPGAKVVVAQ